jgi:hypothetical protein
MPLTFDFNIYACRNFCSALTGTGEQHTRQHIVLNDNTGRLLPRRKQLGNDYAQIMIWYQTKYTIRQQTIFSSMNKH